MKASNLLANNWVVTLTATLVGAFLALYLNEWMASRNMNYQKEIASENILFEISSNQEKLQKSIERHTQVLDFLEFYNQYYIEDEGIIAPPDSMHQFLKKYPDLITIKDSTALDDGNYKYNGVSNFSLSIPHLQLSTIAWRTLKNSGITTNFGFNCLMFLESVDKLVSEVVEKDDVLMEYMLGQRDEGEKDKDFIQHLRILIGYENMLLEIYETSEKELNDCE